MLFTDDTDAALQAAVALVNSTDEPGQPLGSVDDLSAFLVSWSYTGRHDATPDELDAVRRLRPALRELLLAERDEAAEIVNAMLARAKALPQLQRHDHWDWHLHAVDPDRPLDERVVVETAMAMVDVIRANEMSRLARCDEPVRDAVNALHVRECMLAEAHDEDARRLARRGCGHVRRSELRGGRHRGSLRPVHGATDEKSPERH